MPDDDELNGETDALADVLDSLSIGVLLIDGGGYVIHANAQGQSILAASDALRTKCGRLATTDHELTKVLRDAMLASAFSDATTDIADTLPLTSADGARYLVHVLPLRACGRPAAGSARAAILVARAAFEPPSCPRVISRAYNLTPTELRVLLAIVAVGGVPEVAAALGVAQSTVKTHLGRLFEKTGTSRQADLVKLVAGFSPRVLRGTQARGLNANQNEAPGSLIANPIAVSGERSNGRIATPASATKVQTGPTPRLTSPSRGAALVEH
jgi:DNA-binding CsgD family transcriptional regulator